MSKSNIDQSRRKVQEELGTNLAGPLEKYFPRFWVQDTLKELGVQFREAVLCPPGDDLGAHRASPEPGSIV